jgi:hypothetical protein
MEREINNLIRKLDKERDVFLIHILKDTLNKTEDAYNKKYNVSEKEISLAERGLSTVLTHYFKGVLEGNEKFKKYSKICNFSNCEKCNFSITGSYRIRYGDVFYQTNDKTPRCIRCQQRTNPYYIRVYEMEGRVDNCINNVLHENELVKLRSMINKVKTKITNLKSNNEASKY